MEGPDLASFEVVSGKGAYMRSLARDLGAALGCYAHVVALRRTAAGPFTQDHAISLESLEALGHSAAASGALLPIVPKLNSLNLFCYKQLIATKNFLMDLNLTAR